MKQFTQGGSALVVSAVLLSLAVGGAVGYVIGNQRLNQTRDSQAVNDLGPASSEADGVAIGGSKLQPSASLAENAASAPNLTNVVAALRSTGLAVSLESDGPFTVFAPTNDAFSALDGGLEALLKPEEKEHLVKITSYHAVRGAFTAAELKAMAAKGEKLTTINNQTIFPVVENNSLMMRDMAGGKAAVETSDVISSNGVLHIVTAVMDPGDTGSTHKH